MEVAPPTSVTVGILFPGELGSSLGRKLLDGGFRVVTATCERSQRTQRLSSDAGLEELNSAAEIAATADVVISTVPQSAAASVAAQFCRDVAACESRPIFVDLNSLAPETISKISLDLQRVSCRFVDATLHGPASRIADGAVMYVSGEDAEWLRSQLGQVVDTRVVGESPGAASALKLLLGGLNKGLVALFLEMSVLACETDMLPAFLDRCEEYYPEIIALIERLLPTYSQHASRRAMEMHELERHAQSMNAHSSFAHASRQLFQAMSHLNFHDKSGDQGGARDDVLAMLERIGQERILNDLKPTALVDNEKCHDTTEVR